MTSEVLILNKRAVVLGADSAVTTSGGDHPRYSKSANKIFELSRGGNVAATIFGSATIDLLPWEIALKLFRTQLGNTSFSRLDEYSTALLKFLSGNNKLFPAELRTSWIESQFDEAVKVALNEMSRRIFDTDVPLQERRNCWAKEVERLKALIKDRGVCQALTQKPLDEILDRYALTPWVSRVTEQLFQAGLDAVNAHELAALGHEIRYCYPELVLGSTGLVIAGFGEDQIFPAYEHFAVYGHIGEELAYKKVTSFEVTHTSTAMIQPLAQASMINMFTEGFSASLEKIIQEQGNTAFLAIFEELKKNGVDIPKELVQSITQRCQTDFMGAWKSKNWQQNFHPLLGVLQSLSVQEMAHLAESLLSLESLKERVTSSSESVGGPIDVAAITKSEGLVWIRRKHYFDANLNMRYAARLEHSFE
ncbi:MULTISPECIES: hypothetical protein [Giesbergeria]|uniref:Uncharacterized protein n=1 Tax=Giesbergeria sinuosa TaxID=80883 RepID=A0ABV9QBY9_9BURK